MEKYELVIFPAVREDLLEIVDFLNEFSADTAFKLYDEIVAGVGSLEYLALRCPLLKSPVLRAKGYRALVVHNYLVLYIVKDMTVEIRRIIHGKRRYEFML
jgi:plasmid stabilization system protein ParE